MTTMKFAAQAATTKRTPSSAILVLVAHPDRRPATSTPAGSPAGVSLAVGS
ncbi:MAG TPA: hypothetical protein VFX65_13190 [Candidatus Limnocylindrales bacterium]|nr:hypothetical protein [Candidatus Limnocylindrales bacterium]